MKTNKRRRYRARKTQAKILSNIIKIAASYNELNRVQRAINFRIDLNYRKAYNQWLEHISK